jgi:hypothetical protein
MEQQQVPERDREAMLRLMSDLYPIVRDALCRNGGDRHNAEHVINALASLLAWVASEAYGVEQAPQLLQALTHKMWHEVIDNAAERQTRQ